MTDGQRLTILLAAMQDRSASTVFRARASLLVDAIDEFKEPADGLVNGIFLTHAGREVAQKLVREAAPQQDELQVFYACFKDIIQRLRARTVSVDDVKCIPFEGVINDSGESELRVGWRVSWEGQGWYYFSALSQLPEARVIREDLLGCAKELGLTAVADNAPAVLVLLPEAPKENPAVLQALLFDDFQLTQEQILRSMNEVELEAWLELSNKNRTGEENLRACREVYQRAAAESAARWRRERGLSELPDDILPDVESILSALG